MGRGSPKAGDLREIALLGYGRFGRAFSGLVRDAGLAVRAWDPASDVPDDLEAPDLEALVGGGGTIVLAVPVAATRDALTLARPYLGPEHLVVEVGSVKRGPVEVMTELLGQRVPWVATHPLFGPSSIALGERPLRAVVCPNALHETASARARRLYERVGCEVIEQDADVHDRLMARTHAIAFFLAKGLHEFGAPHDAALAPPSFAALSRTIDMVRSDAGHLFSAIERENPYAEEARRELLDALLAVHEQIGSVEDDPSVQLESGLAIPGLGQQAPELRETRELIDEVDQELVALLARRSKLSRRAGRIKAERGRPVRDEAREQALIDARGHWAVGFGLPTEAVQAVFRQILELSRQVQTYEVDR